jgi:lipopolysaccharide assembly outer membrane protein LptD (OstA)
LKLKNCFNSEINKLKYIFSVLLLIFFYKVPPAFSQDKIDLKNADELSGKTIDGQDVREADGNVEFSQGNVRVFCNSATQYLKSNRVELRGNVKIYQDTLTLLTSKANYFGDEKKAICEGGVTLKDPNATLRADNGVYSFSETKAVFKGDVIIINPGYRITSDELTYFRNSQNSLARGNVIIKTDSAEIKADNVDFYRNEGKSFAFGNVRIESDSTIITSDTSTNYSLEKKSVASGKVKIENLSNNLLIYGNRLENYERENVTFVYGNSKLIQSEKDKDTLYIYCDSMEANRNKPEYFLAKGNVEIIRKDFLSKCGKAVYFRDEETVSLSRNPVVWQDRLQMTGDSVFAELSENKLTNIFVRKLSSANDSKTSFVISFNGDENFKDRYDQISGSDITLKFLNDKINLIEVEGNSNSIYFLYEKNKANGLNKIEGEKIFLYFDEEEKISRIKVDTDPKGEFVPESLLNTVNLTLAGFNLREDKPFRK